MFESFYMVQKMVEINPLCHHETISPQQTDYITSSAMQPLTMLSTNYNMLVILLENHLCVWDTRPVPSEFKDTIC